MNTTPQRERDCAEKIGHRIRLLRKAHNFTQVTLAERAGISANYLGRFERGEITISLSKLLRVADALDVSLATLVEPCGGPSAIPAEHIKKALQNKIEALSDLDVLVVDRLADCLHAKPSLSKAVPLEGQAEDAPKK